MWVERKRLEIRVDMKLRVTVVRLVISRFNTNG
jgi:hypothetical protein